MKGATSVDADSIIVVDSPERDCQAGPQKITTRLDIDRDLGVFQMNSLLNRHFSFHQVSLNFNYRVTLPTHSTKNAYGLALMSVGRDEATFNNTRDIDVRGGKGVFTFNPSVPELHRFYPDTPTQVSYFDMNEDYFNSLLFEQDAPLDSPLGKVKEKVLRGEFFDATSTISANHHRIISDILNCPLQGTLGNLMLEGSLQQLIAMQLAALGAASHEKEVISLRDKEIMHAVKDHLRDTFQEDHSLVTLSKHFGINQGKLKKYFKSLFGVPVIEYVFNLKMEHAREMLFNKGIYVAEVSRIVGYKNPNHFATAFKRKFGVNPSRIRA